MTGNVILSITMTKKKCSTPGHNISISTLMDINPITYQVEASKQGQPTLSVLDETGRPVYLHSRIDPSREIELFSRQINPEKFDTIIILGCGLGYHCIPLGAIKERFSRIIVIDIIPGLAEELRKNPDTGFLVSSPVHLFSGCSPEEIDTAFNELISLESTRGIQVLEHIPSMRAFHNYYSMIKSMIARLVRRQAGNIATKAAFGLRYLRNCLLNMQYFADSRPVSSICNVYSGMPSLVITSGPSLEANLELIRRFQDRLVLIAVDSALPVLSRSGISPDIVVSIDPQPYIHEHFQLASMNNSIPVYSLSSHPLAVNKYPGLISLSTHPLAQLIDQMRPGALGSIDSRSGSVTGDALLCARLMGCGAIGITGFDSSFPHYAIYARGSAYQQRFAAYFQTRTSPVEKRNLDYIMISSKKLKAGTLHTRQSFIQYKEIIERLAGSDPSWHAILISPEGLPLQGIKTMHFEDFINTYSTATINKHKILQSRLDTAQHISDIISLTEIKKLLLNNRLREEIIGASLPSDARPAQLSKAERFLKGVCGL